MYLAVARKARTYSLATSNSFIGHFVRPISLNYSTAVSATVHAEQTSTGCIAPCYIDDPTDEHPVPYLFLIKSLSA